MKYQECFSENYEGGNTIETEVVIIGGGASGIAAAQVFHDANIDFLLLEADEKIGGRIQNQQFGGLRMAQTGLMDNMLNLIHLLTTQSGISRTNMI